MFLSSLLLTALPLRVAQVKKVMNSVYQSLREEFDADESYTGAEVMSVVLAAIKVCLPSTQVHLSITALCNIRVCLHHDTCRSGSYQAVSS